MIGGWARVGIAAAAVAAVVAGSALAGTARTPVPGGGRTEVPLTTRELVCPGVPPASGAHTSVSALTAPGPAGAGPGAGGRLAVTTLDGTPPAAKPAAPATPPAPDRPTTVGVDGGVAGVTVRGTGSFAPGLTAGQLTRARGGPLRGWSQAQCVAPGTDAWFVGLSAAVGQHGRIVLTNPGAAPADVDIALYDEHGPIPTSATRGIAVPAHGQRDVDLDQVAPGSTRLAARVVAATGRVAAAAQQAGEQTGAVAAVGWLPVSPAPATRLALPGVAPGHGSRLLDVLAPGNLDAIVTVAVVGVGGTFHPAGAQTVHVTAGELAQVDLAGPLGGAAAALVLTSTVPVVAGLRADVSTGHALAGLAFTAAGAALSGPAVVPDTPAGKGITGTLVLSNTSSGDASARVEVRPATGPATAADVAVPAGSTVAWRVPAPAGADRYGLVVTPDRAGALVAARVVAGSGPDGGVTEWVLSSAPTTATRPVVQFAP